MLLPATRKELITHQMNIPYKVSTEDRVVSGILALLILSQVFDADSSNQASILWNIFGTLFSEHWYLFFLTLAALIASTWVAVMDFIFKRTIDITDYGITAPKYKFLPDTVFVPYSDLISVSEHYYSTRWREKTYHLVIRHQRGKLKLHKSAFPSAEIYAQLFKHIQAMIPPPPHKAWVVKKVI